MLNSDPLNDKWILEYWEYETGKSWVVNEVEAFSKNHILYDRMTKKTSWLLNKKIDEVRIQKDLVSLGEGLYELKIHILNNELRFIGVLKEDLIFQSRPIFYALLFFHKKDQKIKNKYLEKARERFKIYKITTN